MIERSMYNIVVQKSYCQLFRARLGDEKIFDKNRKVKIINELAKLPILKEPGETLEEELGTICKFDIELDSCSEMYEHGKVNLKEKLLSKFVGIIDFSLDDKLIQEVPDSWELYGDLLLLPGKSFSDAKWTSALPEILHEICSVYKVARVARKHMVVNDDFRSPRTDMLLGSDPWVCRKENGITYHFDITKSMFCAGNISEKLRISRFDCTGETVVDLFAGIGYFTLPYLVHARAEHVYACEWNPDSVLALRLNLEKLGLTHRCSVLEGDNRLVCPKNVADRVNLGLIPGSEISWETACEALKDTGGVLHIHGNVEVTKDESKRENMNAWADSTRKSIETLLVKVKERKKWSTWPIHIECVKSYAPRVYHLVLDLKCEPA